MNSELIRCSKKTKILLDIKSENTGKTIKELVEYAVLNMPFIPPKELNTYSDNRGF